MRKIQLALAESALTDLEDIKRWYAGQAVPEVGNRLIREILQRIEGLRDYPDLGRMVPEFGQDFLRELIHPPFRIVFRRETDRVRIVRIWRCERQLELDNPPVD